MIVASLELDPTVAAGGRPSGRESTEAPRPVLHGVSAAIEPGQLVALVGPSGAGKTTLGSLVPRLYDVTAGAVRIDGHDVRDLTQDSLHAAIGVVSQDPHLFHDTIGDNLRYARPDATDAELEAACAGGPDPRRDRRPARGLRHASSASGATGSRAARSSAWPSPACCSRTRPS